MPYRDEKEALRARLEELERTISHIDARAREMEDLRREEPEIRRQRDDLRGKLRELEGRRTLPMLDDVRVASPCGEKWDEMVGDQTSRYCLKCEKNVYDLSSMTREQADALILAKEGKLCVRFYRRADGTILTADCPEGVARKRRRRVAAGVVGAGLLASGAMGAGMLFGTQGEVRHDAGRKTSTREVSGQVFEHAQEDRADRRSTMGQMVAPPPKPVMGHVSRHPTPVATDIDTDPLPFAPPAKP